MRYRSVLFVPGHEEKKIKKAYTLNADLIVLDLESTVPRDKKDFAKKIIKDCEINKEKTYIRINDPRDLEFVAIESFPGIFLPFTESALQLEAINVELHSWEHKKTDIIPIIESMKGISSLQEISNSKSSYRINLLSLGSHDLAKSINLKVSEDEKEITNFRQKIIDHSKNLKKPLDTSYLNFKNLDGFKSSCLIAKKMGFGGKACIHPDQIDISNKIFS